MHTPANRDSGWVPAAGDGVIADAPSNQTIAFSISNTTVQCVTSADGLTVSVGTLAATDIVRRQAGPLRQAGGTVAGATVNTGAPLLMLGGIRSGATFNGVSTRRSR